MNDLYITNLSFPQKFTQKSADLFSEGGTASVAPVVTSEDAVTPFVPGMMIPKLSNAGNVSEKTIFDTYLLESNGGTYNYTLGIKYQGEETEEVYTVKNTAITKISDIKDGGMYIMYNTAGRFLYDNGDKVRGGSSYGTGQNPNPDYIWKFTKTANNRYTIKSMGSTGYYMQSSKVSSSKVPLTVNAGSNDYFTLSNSNSGNRIYFQSTTSSGRNKYYLSFNGSTVCGSTNSRRDFYLYEVVKEGGVASISHQETIPIRIVDKTTGEASQITSVKRNDFIDILVNVTYNEKTGNVEFEVSDWDEVNGEVTFD
jgi:hypothetical protein